VLQCVAVCCSVLQCVAVCYSVLHSHKCSKTIHFSHPNPRLTAQFFQHHSQKCVAVCCSVSQCVTVCFNALQLLQCVAMCCSILQLHPFRNKQFFASQSSPDRSKFPTPIAKVCCSMLQSVSVRFSAFHRVAVHSSVLQCVAVCCSRTHAKFLKQAIFGIPILTGPLDFSCTMRRSALRMCVI